MESDELTTITGKQEEFSFESEIITVCHDNTGGISSVAKDVCNALGIQNNADAIKMLDDDEKGVEIIYTPGGKQKVNVINESGLYTLIMRSRKAVAKRFRKWVTAEVLPSIRRTGQYSVANGPPHDVCILQEAVEKAAIHEAAVMRIALHDLAKQNGITSPEEFSQLARESLSNGDANPNPKLWEIAKPHPDTVKRIMARVMDRLSGQS